MEFITAQLARVVSSRTMAVAGAISLLYTLWTEVVLTHQVANPQRGMSLLLELILQELKKRTAEQMEAMDATRLELERVDRTWVFENWEIEDAQNPWIAAPPPSPRVEEELRVWLAAQEALVATQRGRCHFQCYQGFCTGTPPCFFHHEDILVLAIASTPETPDSPPPPPPSSLGDDLLTEFDIKEE